MAYTRGKISWMEAHLVACNKVFLEVEQEGCEFVFSELVEKWHGKVLLRPTAQGDLNYGVYDGIIIECLVTQASKGVCEWYQVPLEKLIVDLFANTHLMLPKGDYPSAIEEMFARYQIGQIAMVRYARRRNKAKTLSYNTVQIVKF